MAASLWIGITTASRVNLGQGRGGVAERGQMSNREGALSGIRVLDLTRVMSGPYATAMLADLGAEVLKIESIGSGDLSRLFGPHVGDESAYALMLNRGKESLTVDLKHEAGRKLILDLAAKSDVVIENFRPKQ